MDPVIDSEWLGCKNDPIEEARNVGNIARSWQWRERGIDPLHYPSNKTVFENIAEDILVQKPLKIRSCDLPGYPRSTFLMVFSPDGTKVASTHGNHNVYVSELASGKHVRILKGHPRTPWCIAFHPSHPQLIGSGCLGGQVRVWDIASGGSEVWNVRNETVIASIAFHPREQLLVIATYNELYFWDWSQPAPFTKVSTNNVNEKVRYVAFDALGYKLITGISLWPSANNPLIQQAATMGPTSTQSNISRRDDPDENAGASRPQDSPGSAQDMIVNSYQNLVQRYDSLVRNYQRLFMVRHRLTNTPPPPNTIDRGTDPMETDISAGTSGWTRSIGSSTPTAQNNDEPTPSTSRSQDGVDSGDVEGSSRLLNLDVLSFDSDPSRNQESSSQDGNYSLFRSRSSAFHPLSDTGRSFRTVDQNERTTRLLPNPFSSSNGSPRPSRVSFGESVPLLDNPANTSRTSIFTSSRPGSTLARDYPLRRRNFASLYSVGPARGVNTPLYNIAALRGDRPPSASSASTAASPPDPGPSTSTSTATSAPRPTMTNSSTQMSPVSTPVDAQTINESLDLIRDILRDSGTRLLNLITNMSLSTLASVERSMPRRGAARAHSEEAGSGSGAGSSRAASRPQRLYSPTWRRSFLSSSSDSDSDSLEVNIFRTRNSTFREDEAPEADLTAAAGSAAGSHHPTDRMVFELNDETPDEGASRDTGGINVSLSSRFRVRTQSYLAGDEASGAARGTGPCTRDSAAPSTRDTANPTAGDGTGPCSPDGAGSSTRDGASCRDEARPSGRDATSPSTRDGAGPSTSAASETADVPPDPGPRPSTSRDNFWTRGCAVPPDEAYRKVRSGVNALHKHTMQLTNLWLRGNRTTMRELRNMWENLRRRILMLHRETGRQDLPSYYTRSLLERCMILTEMSDGVTRPAARIPRSTPRSEENTRNNEGNRNVPINSANASDTNLTENGVDRAPDIANRAANDGPPATNRTQTRSFPGVRSAPSIRRRLQTSYRWRPEDELRRRSRNPTTNRLSSRYPNRSRRDFARAIEISATRHEIRMRAMQVLSVMFNMMMMCLEERGLSQLIINMLRTLKKALALTCLMLMTNRNGRAGNNPTTSQRVDSLNVVRIQNVDHTGPVNVDGPDDPVSPVTNPPPSEEATGNCSQIKNEDEKSKKEPETEKPSTSQSTSENRVQEDSIVSPPSNESQRWSNRLAVQIAAANRNYSVTARNRRDLYLESRRLKALHRTNPGAHPIIKRRTLPPVSTHRIPALRSLPSRANVSGFITPRVGLQSIEPVAGPSNAMPNDNNATQDPSRHEMMNEFEHRVNFIRIAHMQAVRLRNAARSRFRRLQTIRLYTPSSVREMFALQNNSDNPQENRSPLQNSVSPDVGNRRPIAMYRPHILTPRSDTANRAEELGRFHTVLNNVAMPLMQVNNLPTSAEAQENPGQRLPRIHEYLQPIILAQNAMVVDDEGGGGEGGGGGGGGGGAAAGAGGARRMSGMAGLLDAGILSEALPAPSHRVQAWDFTTGDTPDIADCTKNVVVQRCRIHNDASIDISKDGRLLVALLPVPRLRNTNHWLGVYSLEWARLGQCLHTAVLEQSAVSVALSPTARHLAVGLGSRRFTTAPHARNNVFALLYRLDPLESSSRTGLSPIKELEQTWEYGFTSLNCLRWAPQPGQGLVYANNTGQLIIMS